MKILSKQIAVIPKNLQDYNEYTTNYIRQIQKARSIIQNNKSEADRKNKLSKEMYSFEDLFNNKSIINKMNNISKLFVESLVSLKEFDLASIVYSFLIKMNKSNNTMIEYCAMNALKNAERLQDPFHILARADDLKHLYENNNKNSEKYLKLLYLIKKTLKRITSNYEAAKESYRTISKKVRKLPDYYLHYAEVKYEIAINVYKTDKIQAIRELKEVISIYDDNHLDKDKLYELALQRLNKLEKKKS